MGILGSKEQLGQIVTIFGHNANDFAWKESTNSTTYQTSGLIINCHDKKYVITTRSRLTGCKNIIMFHSYFDEKDTIMRNNLHILFQSIEYNIIILGTLGKNELDLALSELVSGGGNGVQLVDQSYKILVDKVPVMPTRRSHYYTIRFDVSLDSDKITYKTHIYDVKFIKSLIYNNTFLPENCMFEFNLLNTKHKLYGISGAVIFNKKKILVGMVTKTESNNLYILPTTVLKKIVSDFTEFMDKPLEYAGPLMLPFKLRTGKKMEAKIKELLQTDTELEKNDKLVSIDGKELIFNDDNIFVIDNDYKNPIPIDLYIRFNFKQNSTIPVTIMRKKKLISTNIQPIPLRNTIFPLTTQPDYNPLNPIPFVNIKNCIIVEFTHELLDIMAFNKIEIVNDVITDFFDNFINKPVKHFFIIDCLDKLAAKKYNLPQLVPGKKHKVNCPVLISINNEKITNLSDIEKIPTYGTCILKIGASYKEPQEIFL